MGEETAMSDQRPALRVIAGSPTDEELAVVVAVLSARAAARPVVSPTPLSLWSRKGRNVRPPQHPGPGAWRASMMPR
jgi:hypothetical protein